MRAYSSDVIGVDIHNVRLSDDETHLSIEAALDIPAHTASAYYQISVELQDFLKSCHEQYGIVGFEYDTDKCNRSLGVIIRAKES